MSSSPEKKLILSCLRSINSDKARAECDAILTGALNWDSILATVIHAKIASCFFNQLQLLGLDKRIPSSSRHKFERYYYKIGYQNILIFEQLGQLIQLLANAGVDVIALKGTALQAEVWKNFSLREMADIDLLVRSKDLILVEDVLRKNGYIPKKSSRPAEYYRKHHHHLVPFVNFSAAFPIAVEIHHNINQPVDPTPVDMADFWKSSRVIEFNHSTLRVLSPENLLVNLCMKLTYTASFLDEIRCLLDISQVVSHFGPTIQWARIVKMARSPGMANYLFYGLYFSKIVMGAAIPHKILEQIRTHVSLKFLSHHLLCFLVKQYCIVPVSPPPLIPIYKLQFVCRDIIRDVGIADKLKTLRYEFFPDKVDDSGRKESVGQRITFICAQLFNNLRNR